jgi:transcriptional regulator with XRE-family HTH domain
VNTQVLYGYVRERDVARVRLVAHAESAEVVRRIFAERAAGSSYEAIAAGLNRDGIPSSRGGLWSQSGLAYVLRNPAYAGRSQGASGVRRSRREYEPIVDEATFSRVQAVGATSLTRAHRRVDDLDTLGQRIRMRRAEVGLTQTEVARRAGIASSFVSRLERGLRKPHPQILYAVAAALETSVLSLMGESTEHAVAGEASETRVAGPQRLRNALRSLERGFPWLRAAERDLVLSVVKLLAERAEAARQRSMPTGSDGFGRPAS